MPVSANGDLRGDLEFSGQLEHSTRERVIQPEAGRAKRIDERSYGLDQTLTPGVQQ